MQDEAEPLEETESEAPPDCCLLDHDLFNKLGAISFRRADTDGTPMMMVPFGEREAGVPLRSLQLAFGIADDSADGRMLGLIAESLDYITSLKIGDKLPDEVVSGNASWQPTAAHRLTAATRLRLQLLAWLDPAAARDAQRGGDLDAKLESSPTLRGKVQNAFREAATALDLATSEEVVAIVERLTEELSYIEALRNRLLHRVQTLAARLAQIGHSSARMDGERREVITQVQRLTAVALAQFRSRFDEVDAQTGEVIATLRNADSQISYIRSNRDGLYRILRAWEPVLDTWAKSGASAGFESWQPILDTYQFLARRYLPVSEWPNFNTLRQGGAARKPEHAMVW